MKLTQEQIEEIRKRAEAATPGPWKWVGPDDTDDFGTDMGRIESTVESDYTVCDFGDCEQFYPTEGTPFEECNLDFVINARQDVPALLAHIAKLDAEAWYWRNESAHWQKQAEDYREKGKRLFDERNMWKGLRLEAGGRLGEVVPRLAELENENKTLRQRIAKIEWRR